MQNKNDERRIGSKVWPQVMSNIDFKKNKTAV